MRYTYCHLVHVTSGDIFAFKYDFGTMVGIAGPIRKEDLSIENLKSNEYRDCDIEWFKAQQWSFRY